MLERREIVGGACVTEEIAPGCRASTTSYIASMLRPEVIRDLRLGDHGLRMVPCEPGLQVPFLDGEILPWWSDDRRTSDEIRRFSARDAATFLRVQDELKKLARYLQPYFLEPPPDIHARGPARILEALRHAMRFRRINGDEIGQMVAFLTGSLGDYLDRNFESDKVKTLYLANNVYGKHGGPYQPGTAIGLLFHLLSGGDHDVQGFYGHVIGGMGAITGAMAEAAKGFGAEIRTDAPVARIDARGGRATGVTLEDGTEITRAADPVERRPQAHVPRTGRQARAARRLPPRHRGHQDGRPLREGELRAEPGAAAVLDAGRRRPGPAGRCSRWCRRWSSRSAATTRRRWASCPRSCGWTASWRRTSTTRWRRRASTS